MERKERGGALLSFTAADLLDYSTAQPVVSY